MMDLSQQKEQFSFAYVRAVAAAAGYGVSEPSVDDDSIDLSIASRSATGSVKRPRLELQVKCTEAPLLDEDSFRFPLKPKNYEDLRVSEVLVPRILVVVRVPDDVGDWLQASDEALVLRRCGYWRSLRGMVSTENKSSISVELSRQDRFTVDSLRGIMDRISKGEHS